MSTNSILRVEGTAWQVASDVKDAIRRLKTSEGIVQKLGLDYTVSAHNMKTDIEEPVPGYYGIYRDDETKFLGPVKSDNPTLVQNCDTFKVIEPMLREGILKPECVDTYSGGSKIWGCFKYNDPFKILDDEFTQYFIIVNDHLKPNGNLEVISSPVRIACMNAFGTALNRSTMRFTLPAIVDEKNLPSITETILNAYTRTIESLSKSVDSMIDIKIDDASIQAIMDELFPFIDETSQTSNHDRANASIQNQRDTFITCLNADDIKNYQGTAYAVYNALTDYAQHYFTKSEKGFSLDNRMSIIPGIDPLANTDNIKISKFLKNMKKFAIAA